MLSSAVWTLRSMVTRVVGAGADRFGVFVGRADADEDVPTTVAVEYLGDFEPALVPGELAFLRHVELDVADLGDDVEVAAESDDVGAQDVQADGVAVLDLADRKPNLYWAY
ncbi:MAG: hypothetical protein SYR96_29330 [Actinomycetota bacterium]|nr:hypothetical protein [Actinomycetota bacterium]